VWLHTSADVVLSPAFCVMLEFEQSAKLKRKHWEPEARAERHLARSRPAGLSPSIANKNTSASTANQGGERRQDRVVDCLRKF